MATNVQDQSLLRNTKATKILAYLIIRFESQVVIVDVSSVSMRFGVGGKDIPSAEFTIPAGAPVYDNANRTNASGLNSKITDFSKLLSKFNEKTKIECWVNLDGVNSQDTSWAGGYHLVWAGYYISHGATQRYGSLAFKLNSVHWLRDMDLGAVVSDTFARTNYLDVLTRDIINPGRLADSSFFSDFIFNSLFDLAGGNIDPATIDVWKNIVAPALGLAMYPSDDTGSIDFNSRDKNKANYATFIERLQTQKVSCGNTDAIAAFKNNDNVHLGNIPALSRLWNTEETKKAVLAERKKYLDNTVKYPSRKFVARDDVFTNQDPGLFGFNNSAEIVVGTLSLAKYASNLDWFRSFIPSVLNSVRDVVGTQVGSSSAIDKLYTLANIFYFDIVATCRTATAVPLLPVFKSDQIWRTIKNNQLLGIQVGNSYYETLSGVVLIGSMPSIATSTVAGDINDSRAKLLSSNSYGAFIGQKDGRLLMLEAPRFLLYMGQRTPESLDEADKNTINSKTCITAATPADKVTFTQVGCDYSRLVWLYENYKNKLMTITTPLRFDIAPGSHLAIEGIDLSQFGDESSTTTVYGFAKSVGIEIDIVSGSATSTFTISHIRGQLSKQDDENLIPLNHPMYAGDPWIGSPLVRINSNDLTAEGQTK